MTDIVERLRARAEWPAVTRTGGCGIALPDPDCDDAAREIERLRAEVASLRASAAASAAQEDSVMGEAATALDCLMDEVNRLREAQVWRPMREAKPGDGTILVRTGRSISTAVWYGCGWMTPEGFVEPTHWFPMPKLPEQKRGA